MFAKLVPEFASFYVMMSNVILTNIFAMPSDLCASENAINMIK